MPDEIQSNPSEGLKIIIDEKKSRRQYIWYILAGLVVGGLMGGGWYWYNNRIILTSLSEGQVELLELRNEDEYMDSDLARRLVRIQTHEQVEDLIMVESEANLVRVYGSNEIFENRTGDQLFINAQIIKLDDSRVEVSWKNNLISFFADKKMEIFMANGEKVNRDEVGKDSLVQVVIKVEPDSRKLSVVRMVIL